MLSIMLEEFPFASLWNTGIFLFIAFAAVIYLFLLPQEKKHSWWKSVCFFLGLMVLFIATGSPINIIGRIQFSVHIIQVVLLCVIVPPLLLLGMKRTILDRALRNKWVTKIVSFLVKPYVSISVFFLTLYIYHHPPIFDKARVDLYGNYFYLLALFATALLLWIPIIRESDWTRTLIYHVVCIGMIVPLAGILLFSKEILYQAYTDLTTFTQALEVCLPAGAELSPQLVLQLLPFEPVAEQQLGGRILFASVLVVFTVSSIIKRQVIKKV
ncbi:cytochrome c oxidase assembly protein [Ornithinibacillus sp. BX22]|uniref:Cytochrome c oxidase assembly protein n=1 Tax=Ornithinibacillus hominis TaxID=2763055 RepID=A0A923L4W4_9BACI|nr:cytochrome c oxidase assembly protein [Ornithinibacillus hominis]MBC5636543.1 cytochrome c oxidase assembly protein [Ornithinibacillus hominis]